MPHYLYLLQGCDARVVPGFTSMQGSVRQVASQFNNGESKGRYATTPNKFKTDPTQGPAEQRTFGGAAIARYAHSSSCDCCGELLSDPLISSEFNTLFDYQHGDLTPKAGQEQNGLEFLKKHINKLALNIERVGFDGVLGQSVVQVLNSGLALGYYDQYKRKPEDLKYINEMSELLLTAQYKLVSAVAILEAQNNPDKRIPVTFTLVGGGVFGNDKIAISRALSQSIKFIQDSGVANIDICLSVYSATELNEYINITASGDEFVELREILNQKPISQSQLHSLPTLARSKKFDVLPIDKCVGQSDTLKTYFDAGIDKAMRAAISTLSSKAHLSSEGRTQKMKLLEEHLNAYREASNPEDAKQAILDLLHNLHLLL